MRPRPAAERARRADLLCSYECTFCATCVEDVLHDVCPNYGCGFEPRPLRPATAWRQETGLTHDPPSARRRHTPYDVAQIEVFVTPLCETPPGHR